MLLSQTIATMIPTVKFERYNTLFTIEDILKGEFNWNLYAITPPCYVIKICILYRLYFKQHDFLKEEVIVYTHANFHHATGFTFIYSIVYSSADQRKHPRHLPLCGEFTGDRWLPRTKDQWRGTCSIWYHTIWSIWKLTSHCETAFCWLINWYLGNHRLILMTPNKLASLV